MTELPYTDEELRTVAARVHASAARDTDDRINAAVKREWGARLDTDQLDEAGDAVLDLLDKTVNVSEWAVDIGADGLEPLDSVLSMQTNTGPLTRIHFAVRPDMPDDVRRALVEGLAVEIAKYLPSSDPTAVTIPFETAAHVLFHERLGGWPPSTFATKLLNLWTSADTENAERLASAFPDYAAAIALVRQGQPGIDQLRAIADGT